MFFLKCNFVNLPIEEFLFCCCFEFESLAESKTQEPMKAIELFSFAPGSHSHPTHLHFVESKKVLWRFNSNLFLGLNIFSKSGNNFCANPQWLYLLSGIMATCNDNNSNNDKHKKLHENLLLKIYRFDCFPSHVSSVRFFPLFFARKGSIEQTPT